jgi:putative colanic acid biosynthesis acetyltransferase WcaF
VKRELRAFSGGSGFTFLRLLQLASWQTVQHIFFKAWFFPTRGRATVLRIWGAKIGTGVQIRRGVRVHFPWNLEIGDYCWIGEDVWFINHEKVVIASNVCISQRSIVCSGGHDYRSATLKFAHAPIQINDGAWICFDAKILPGVTVGECAVVSAGEIVRKSLPDYSMFIGGQIRKIEPPK